MANIHIYQIFYSEKTRLEIDSGFMGLDNISNERPDWSEYWPIRNYLLNQDLNDNDFYGFFSPKFKSKTNLDSSTVHEFIRENMDEADVFLFSPFFDQSAFPLNMFEQGAAQHDDIMAAFNGSVALITPGVDLASLVMDSRNTVFCNNIVAKPSFWKAWLDKCEIIFREAENSKTGLAIALNSGTNHDGKISPNKVFVIERIASLLLCTQPGWRIKTFNPVQLPYSPAQVAKYPLQLVQLDALKMAGASLGFPEYFSKYWQIRNTVVESIQRSYLNDNVIDLAGDKRPDKIVLSVCIPTYNRSKYTAAAINSVLKYSHGVSIEIVVCDNASTDDTEEIIGAMVSEYPNTLKYYRNPLNIGPERNFLRLIEHAVGKYCWILGSDDEITQDAIPAVIRAMEDNPDLIMGDAVDCDIDLNESGMLKFLTLNESSLDFSDRRNILTYFKAATMNASLFGYISSMVFKRQRWNDIPINRTFIGSGYIQVSRALDMIIKNPGKLHYLAHPIAKDRRNNCSYMEEFGQYARLLLDVRMFQAVLNDYFATDIELRNEYKEFVRRCYGGKVRGSMLTGNATVDTFLTTFWINDEILPEKKWSLRSKVMGAKSRLQLCGVYEKVFSGDSILHLGYRGGEHEFNLPVNERAIGVELGFAGYDGVLLPFENESQDAVWVSFCLHRITDAASAVREWLRVLKPGGFLIISSVISKITTQSVSAQSVNEQICGNEKVSNISLSQFFVLIDDALRADSCQIFHCSQTEPLVSSVDGRCLFTSEIDFVLKKCPSC